VNLVWGSCGVACCVPVLVGDGSWLRVLAKIGGPCSPLVSAGGSGALWSTAAAEQS
jgi:hypothetical protein